MIWPGKVLIYSIASLLIALQPFRLIAKEKKTLEDKVQWRTAQTACSSGDVTIQLSLKTAEHVAESQIRVAIIGGGGGKLSTQGIKGSAQLLSGTKTWITLNPESDNVLTGYGKFGYEPDLEMELFLEVPGRGALQARLSPFHEQQGTPPCYQR